MKLAIVSATLISALVGAFHHARQEHQATACFAAHGWTVQLAQFGQTQIGGTAHPSNRRSPDYWENYVIWLRETASAGSYWSWGQVGFLSREEKRVAKTCLAGMGRV